MKFGAPPGLSGVLYTLSKLAAMVIGILGEVMWRPRCECPSACLCASGCRCLASPPQQLLHTKMQLIVQPQLQKHTNSGAWEFVTNARGAGGGGSAIFGLPLQPTRAATATAMQRIWVILAIVGLRLEHPNLLRQKQADS